MQTSIAAARSAAVLTVGVLTLVTAGGCADGDAPAGAPSTTVPSTVSSTSPSEKSTDTMTIRITSDHHVLTVELQDSKAGRAFADQLPLDLDVTDFHGIEKIADLPEPLPVDETPAGYEPRAGDVTYYAPWGNLAIFYRDFEYSTGLVPLGRVIDGAGAVETLGGSARLERVDPTG